MKKFSAFINLHEGGMKASGEDLFKRKNRKEFIAKGRKNELIDVDGNPLKVLNKKSFNALTKLLTAVDDHSELDPTWKKLHKDVFGVLHSKIDKIANGFSTVSGKNPAGEDWESIIAVSVNKIQGRKWNQGPEWERAEKFWGDWEDQGMKLGQEFIKKIKVSSLEQLGASTLPTNKEWKGRNKTPKTDLVGGKKRISLKKYGGSQLLSAGKDEAISTVEAAMKMYSVNSSGKKKINSLLTNLEKKMIMLTEKGTVESIDKLADKKTLTPKDQERIGELSKGRKFANQLTKEMEELFNSDPLMKDYFCWEAASGQTKFEPSPTGISNVMVTFRETGSISDVLPLKTPEIEGRILSKGNNFYISFKTANASSRPYLALRSKKAKNESYQPTLADIITEECAKERVGAQILSEGVEEQLDEFQIFSKIINKTKNIIPAVKNKAKKILEAIMKRISAAFNALKKLGKKLLDEVLNFFGLSINNVKIKGGGKYPIKI